MDYLYFFLFACFEYLIVSHMTNSIALINYDFLFNYTTFKFNAKEHSPIGLNYIINIFFPAIYIIILSGIFYNLNLNNLINKMYIITIFFYIIRWIKIVVCGKHLLVDWKSEIFCFLISFFIGYIIYFIFITKTNDIFPSIEELKNGIWLAIITFFLHYLFEKLYNKPYLDTNKHKNRINNYIIDRYENFSSKYDYLIITNNKKLKILVYAIMIYEDFNRPKVLRFFEYIKLFFYKSATLGIMQVNSKKIINDKQSVEEGFKKIKNCYMSSKHKKHELRLKEVIYDYNKSYDYVDEIIEIYNILYKKN